MSCAGTPGGHAAERGIRGRDPERGGQVGTGLSTLPCQAGSSGNSLMSDSEATSNLATLPPPHADQILPVHAAFRYERSSGFKKCAELGRRLELQDRLQLLERRGRRIGQALPGPRLKFLVLRIEMAVVDNGCEMLRCLQITFAERTIDDQLGRGAESREGGLDQTRKE